MSLCEKVDVMYFTDILCVWSYLEQVRLDKLKEKFKTKITFAYHFIPIFGCVAEKMENDWSSKGGVVAYSKFVKSIADKYPHINIHPDIWVKNKPTTSISSHIFLKSIQLLEEEGGLTDLNCVVESGRSVFETAVWRIRCAFFEQLVDVSNYQNLLVIAQELKLPADKIREKIDSGLAHAALFTDLQLKIKHEVKGSPTLVFNEGRQIIYGNVGYKVIEANIEELLKRRDADASWC